jgi:Tfp pilus assembly protein PilO
MTRSKSSSWVVGTILVAAILAVAAWFLLISPVRSAAADITTQAQAVEDSNGQLQIQTHRLAEQYTHLDEYKNDLAALRVQVPSDAQLSEYLRQLDTIATERSVTLTSVSPATATAFAPPVAQSATETDVEGAGTTDSSNSDTSADAVTSADATDDSSSPAPAQPASSAPDGMLAVPLSLTAVGTYDAMVSFLDALQSQTPRLMLVSTVSGIAQTDQAAGGGRPETSLGDLEINVTGYLYVLPDTAAAAPTPGSTEPSVLPAPVPGKNPFVPIG